MAEISLKSIKLPRTPSLNLSGLFLKNKSKKKEKTVKLKQYILPSDESACDYSHEDLFQRENISLQISDSILNSSGQMNFLVSGKWGIGKTSILNGIEKDLKGKNISIMWFSPWRYSSSDEKSNAISRAFLVNLAEILNKPQEIKNLYLNRKIETHRNIFSQFLIWISLFFVTALFIIALIYFGSLIFGLFPMFNWKIPRIYNELWNNLINIYESEGGRNKVNVILALIGLLSIPSIGDFFMSRTRQSAEISKEISPEQLEKSFQNIINNSLKFNFLQKFISWWETSVEETFLSFLGKPLTIFLNKNILKPFKLKKLVVFVDDLDRCNNKEINEFLTSMKTFLFDKRVYFVIAADIEEIAKVNKEGRDYLRKIIQIDWSVPYLEEESIKSLIKYLVKISKIEDKTINIEQIINYSRYSPNPRKIKYYFRRTLFILNHLERTGGSYSSSDITMLYKLILLSDLDEKLFDRLANNRELYFKAESEPGNHLLYESKFKEGKEISAKHIQGKFLKIIKDIPRTSDITKDWSEIISLISSIEGEADVSLDFIKLAGGNILNDAISYLKKVSYDFESLIKILVSDINQGIGKIAIYLPPPEDLNKAPDNLLEIGNKIITLCKSLTVKEYRQDHEEFCSDIAGQFFQSLEKLNSQIIIQYLWNFQLDNSCRDAILNLFSIEKMAPKTWFITLISDPYFNDFSKIEEITKILDENKVGYYAMNPELSSKFVSFIDTNAEQILSKIEETPDLVDLADLENKFAELNLEDESRNRILKIILDNNFEIRETVFNDLLEYEDYFNLGQVVGRIYSNQVLKNQLKKHIIENINLEASGVFEFIKSIWEIEKMNGLDLWDSNLLSSINIKISQITNQSLKNEYLKSLISISTQNIEENKASILCQFYESLIKQADSTKGMLFSEFGKSRLRIKINKLCGIKKVINSIKNERKTQK
ncbi:MAG: P-loop NTPase fold protein [Candidatus Shapirobacteria bacterium]